MGRRTDIDWQAIERDFRLGQFTLRQIAAKHNLTAGSISRKFDRRKETKTNMSARHQSFALYKKMNGIKTPEGIIERMAIMFCVNNDIWAEMGWPDVTEVRNQVNLDASRADIVLRHTDRSVTIVEVKKPGLSLREYCTGIGQLWYQAAAAVRIYRTLSIRRVLCLPGPVPRELVKAAIASETDILPVPSRDVWDKSLADALS